VNSIAKSITVLEKENLNKSSLYAHLPTMGDDLGKFQDYPLKTVGLSCVHKNLLYMHKQIFENLEEALRTNKKIQP